MVGWYQSDDDPGKLLTKSPPASPGGHSQETEDHENTDLVIILVTHGAGCNALIGALTNQPVLLDVGMASLTMAVRRPTPASSPFHTPGHSRESSGDDSISDQYEVKLVANTEHLRSSTSSTPSVSRTPSVSGNSTFQERFINGRAFDANKGRPVTTSSNFGSIRRTVSVAGAMPRSYHAARKTSVGLWGSPAQEEAPEEVDSTDDMILNFGDDDNKDSKENKPLVDEEKDEKAEELTATGKENEEDDVAPLGLWGSPRPPGYAEKIREIAPKRRWTVNERT